MQYLKKLGKFILFTLISIILLGLMLNALYYFDIISNNVYNIMKMVIILVILFINSSLLV